MRLPWPLLLAFEEDELLKDLLFGKKQDLEEGRAYLVKEKKPERALAVFQQAIDAGWRPLYITRQHPNHVIRRRGNKDIRVVWLSTTLGRDYVDAHNLNSPRDLVGSSPRDAPRTVRANTRASRAALRGGPPCLESDRRSAPADPRQWELLRAPGGRTSGRPPAIEGHAPVDGRPGIPRGATGRRRRDRHSGERPVSRRECGDHVPRQRPPIRTVAARVRRRRPASEGIPRPGPRPCGHRPRDAFERPHPGLRGDRPDRLEPHGPRQRPWPVSHIRWLRRRGGSAASRVRLPLVRRRRRLAGPQRLRAPPGPLARPQPPRPRTIARTRRAAARQCSLEHRGREASRPSQLRSRRAVHPGRGAGRSEERRVGKEGRS